MEYKEISLFGSSFFLGIKNQALVWADWHRPPGVINKSHPLLLQVEQELREYLEGKRKVFTFKMDPQGTPFQKKVWKALLKVSWGKTISYSEMASLIGNPLSVRAVASAIGKNPIAIFIPCHRVIAKDGGPGGYSGGLPNKIKLLTTEGHSFYY